MSTPSECFPVCPTSTPVQVPGPTGSDGVSAFTTTTSPISLNMPQATLVTINFANCQWVSKGELLLIADGTYLGHFLAAAFPQFPYTSLSCYYYPQSSDTAANSNVSISAGATVTPSAWNGSNVFTTTTGQIVLPSLSTPQVIFSVNSNGSYLGTSAMVKGMVLAVSDGTYTGHFLITGITNSQITANFLGSVGDSASGSTIATGALVVPSGADGQACYSVTLANFNLPASQNTQTSSIPLLSNSPFVVGENVMAEDSAGNRGTFTVYSINTDGSHIVLTWLNQQGDSAHGTTIQSGAKLTPIGLPAPQNFSLFSDFTDYNVTNVTTKTNFHTWNIPANTLVAVGDSIEFEAWIVFTTTAGTQQFFVSCGTATTLTTYAMTVNVNGSIAKIQGRISLSALNPSPGQLTLANFGVFDNSTSAVNAFSDLTFAGSATSSSDPTAQIGITISITPSSLTNSADLIYFIAKYIPA